MRPDQLQYEHSQVRGISFQIVAGRAQTGQKPGLVSGVSKSFMGSHRKCAVLGAGLVLINEPSAKLFFCCFSDH